MDTVSKIKQQLLQDILPNVVFDGWAPAAFDAAVASTGIGIEQAKQACPRGAIDLAVLAHKNGDAAFVDAFEALDTEGLRYSEKVAKAVELRLSLAGSRDVVRRSSALFSLPHLAVEGSSLIWGTADAIWTGLGDTSEDLNWYTKRATLSAVYASALLYWLGSDDDQQIEAFIARRIANVMRFEKFKSDAKASKTFGPLAGALSRLSESVRAPSTRHKSDFPGYVESD